MSTVVEQLLMVACDEAIDTLSPSMTFLRLHLTAISSRPRMPVVVIIARNTGGRDWDVRKTSSLASCRFNSEMIDFE